MNILLPELKKIVDNAEDFSKEKETIKLKIFGITHALGHKASFLSAYNRAAFSKVFWVVFGNPKIFY